MKIWSSLAVFFMTGLPPSTSGRVHLPAGSREGEDHFRIGGVPGGFFALTIPSLMSSFRCWSNSLIPSFFPVMITLLT